LFKLKRLKVKRDWDHHPSVESLLSENVKMCIDNLLQPEPRKRWTIDTILDCDWIKMNRRLIKMNEQELLALTEAMQRLNITDNQKHLKKIGANKSDTQQILNKQLPRFLSVTQKIESLSNIIIENPNSNMSIYNLRRSARIMHAGNLLVTNSKI